MRDVEILIPLVIGSLMMLIPIVAILTTHQRKMAELMREDANRQRGPIPTASSNTDQQLREIRDLMAQQTLAIDSLVQSQRELTNQLRTQNTAVTERLQESR